MRESLDKERFDVVYGMSVVNELYAGFLLPRLHGGDLVSGDDNIGTEEHYLVFVELEEKLGSSLECVENLVKGRDGRGDIESANMFEKGRALSLADLILKKDEEHEETRLKKAEEDIRRIVKSATDEDRLNVYSMLA